MSDTNLPAIVPSSPLAEGGTVNIRPVGDQHQLRVWIAGHPVENSMHPSAMAACKKLISVLPASAVGFLLGALSRAEMGSD